MDRPTHPSGFVLLMILLLAAVLAGCKGRTHITGTVKNKWGSPVYLATVTLGDGKHMQNVRTSQDGKFDIALEHSPFKTALTLTVTDNIYKTTERSFSSADHLKTIDLVVVEQPEPTLAEIRKLQLKGLSLNDATKLAELMCLQLPNAAGFPMKSFLSGDDVHDTLVLLSGVAQPCLVEHLVDSGWMPDSRSEPLADFHAGDAAFWILADAGLNWDIVVPLLNQKRWNGVGVYEYFDWVNRGNHRKEVQRTARKWLQEHPDCCGAAADFTDAPEAAPISKISAQRFAELQRAWKQLKPGMDAQAARKLLGAPEAIANTERLEVMDLNRFEKSAEFYVVENRTNKSGFDFMRRDSLRDRYVIVFYGENGKFIRAFSNVAELPPIYPTSEKLWSRMIEDSETKWQEAEEQRRK